MNYAEFLDSRRHSGRVSGVVCDTFPHLYPFQNHVTAWAVERGRAAIFADCGLGKTPMQLSWSQAIVEATSKHVMIATPLAVAHQAVKEADKFGIPAVRSVRGELPDSASVVVTNYERLHYFDPSDFAGMVCDESSILKNFNGARRGEITQFMLKLPYRLLCTATAAPNDYIELGTSSEALGEMGHMDMLGKFFKNEQGNSAIGRQWGAVSKWRFKGHARLHFWRWVCSWARAFRSPSDLGFDDDRFELPPLDEQVHVVNARMTRPGYLFNLPAQNIREEREERRRTIKERCARVAEMAAHTDQVLIWCHLNDEGDLLERMIPDAVQVAGRHDDDQKEQSLRAFADGDIRVLVTKPKIGAWGLNLQKCAHVICFPSHSYEQYYQGIRRCWRFGQTRPVRVDIVATDGEKSVIDSLHRKTRQADIMFTELVAEMNSSVSMQRQDSFPQSTEVPGWLSQTSR